MVLETVSLNEEIEKMLKERGALRVGFVTLETMAGGPPGADLTYMIPKAQSAIGFAIPLKRELIRPYLAKEYPNARGDHELDNIEMNVRATRMARDVAKFLRSKGFSAVGLIANNKYREDVPGWQASLPPELSIRYLAVRSGVASFGWSGNVGIKGIGSPIILGAVITSAKLEPTDPIPPEESHCNKCKLCVRVCAYRMFSEDEETSIILGGVTFTYSKRINKLRCVLTCGGYNGLDKSGKWSTWSPGRYEYPEDNYEVNRLMSLAMTSTRKRPKIKDSSKGYVPASYSGSGNVDPLSIKTYDTVQLTCGNCQLICWGNPKETAENYKILTNSGCVIQSENGEIIALSSEKAREEFEKMDPKRKRLYYKNYKKRISRKAKITQLMP